MKCPDAPLTSIERGRNGCWLLSVVCPQCQREHTHGGGRLSDADEIRSFLGHRAAHCLSGNGYMLTDPDDVIGRTLMKRGQP